MIPTDEEIREMIASLRESAGGKYALGPAEYWHIDRAADALESLQSDLSSAREEIDRIGKYLFRAQVALHMCNSVFVPGNDDANARIADFLAELDENFSSDKAEEWASEALRSSRTKGE